MGLNPVRDLTLFNLLFLVTSCLVFAQEESENSEIRPDRLLLQDFQPRSIYNIPVTKIEKARFSVIDMHSHNYATTELLVAKWAKDQKRLGIEKTILLVSRAGKGFDSAVSLYAEYSSQFELWCGIDFKDCDAEGWAERAILELERCVSLGAQGVRELSDKGGGLVPLERGKKLHIDDERMDAILRRCGELGLPVNIHVGEDRWMYEKMDRFNDGLMNAYTWRITQGEGVLGHSEVIDTLDRAAAKHPNTIFIGCHLANCCQNLSRLAKMLDDHPNLYADLGARYGEIAPIPRSAAAFLEKYQDRVFYGTDMGMSSDMYRTTFRVLETEDEHFYPHHISKYHWPWHGLGLSESVLEKIYSGNAKRLFSSLRK